MGEITAGRVIFGPDDAAPLLDSSFVVTDGARTFTVTLSQPLVPGTIVVAVPSAAPGVVTANQPSNELQVPFNPPTGPAQVVFVPGYLDARGSSASTFNCSFTRTRSSCIVRADSQAWRG